MKFEVETEKFEKITYTLDKILYQGLVYFTEDGILIKQPDSSGHSLVRIEIGKDFFESYEVDEPKAQGVNYEDLHSLISRANSETIEVEVGDRWNVEFGENEFTIPVLNLQPPEEFSIEDLELESEFKANRKDFTEDLENLYLVEQPIKFTHDGERLNLKAESKTTSGETSILLTDYNDVENSTLIGDGKIEDYSKVLSKVVDSSKDLRFEMGEQQPLYIDAEVMENLEFKFVIAPRIED